MPRVTSSHTRTVKFSPPSAMEFDSHNPVGALTPVPAQVSLKRFTVIQQSKDNSAMLAEWDDSFSVDETQGHCHSLGSGIVIKFGGDKGKHFM
jgi:hypothetical protein